jgi:hypothetical protein
MRDASRPTTAFSASTTYHACWTSPVLALYVLNEL